MTDFEVGRTTRWVGFIYFAGVLLMLAGGLEMTQGFIALFRKDYYAVTSDGLVLSMNYTAWGWLHLAIAFVMIATGVGMFLGSMWARVLGIVIAGLSTLATMAFLPAYPIWGTVVLSMNVLVIYALTVHGREPAYV
jgi:hypothetical protein